MEKSKWRIIIEIAIAILTSVLTSIGTLQAATSIGLQ